MILPSFSVRSCRHLVYSPWVNFRLTCAQSLSSLTMLSAARQSSSSLRNAELSLVRRISLQVIHCYRAVAARSMKLGLACYASRGKKTRALRRRNSGSETSKLQSVSRANTQKPRSLLPAPLASRVAPPQGRSASAAPRMTWSVFSRPPTPGFYCELPHFLPRRPGTCRTQHQRSLTAMLDSSSSPSDCHVECHYSEVILIESAVEFIDPH